MRLDGAIALCTVAQSVAPFTSSNTQCQINYLTGRSRQHLSSSVSPGNEVLLFIGENHLLMAKNGLITSFKREKEKLELDCLSYVFSTSVTA